MAVDAVERARFNREDAPKLADQVGVPAPFKGESKQFAYFADDHRLVLVVSEHVGDVGEALVFGLAEKNRNGRKVVLLLPKGREFATRQRAPWLVDEVRPEIWTYSKGRVTECKQLSPEETIDAVLQWANGGKRGGPEAELRAASITVDATGFESATDPLVEWATSHTRLDPGHRQGERAWHCAGQKVLSFIVTKKELRVFAGIHDDQKNKKPTLVLLKDSVISASELQVVRNKVDEGIRLRLEGKYLKPDEHWMQSVLRRYPILVGVEDSALREVPAWRPGDKDKTFRRGYLDIVGLDGHGNIRLVEAKLAKSTDQMTLLQGIDYCVWASAYIDALRSKLSAPAASQLRLHYAVGKVGDSQRLLPPRIYNYRYAIDTDKIPFVFHEIEAWDNEAPDPRALISSKALAKNELPKGIQSPS